MANKIAARQITVPVNNSSSADDQCLILLSAPSIRMARPGKKKIRGHPKNDAAVMEVFSKVNEFPKTEMPFAAANGI